MKFYEKNYEYLDRVLLETDKEEIYTYKDIDKYSEVIKKGTNTRETVFILCEKSSAFILGFLSFLRNKVIVYLIDEKLQESSIKDLIEAHEPNYIFINNKKSKKYEDFNEVLAIDNMVLMKNSVQRPVVKNKDLALLISTSGSTGSPKFVKITYDGFETYLENLAKVIGYTKNDVSLTILPLNYIYGLGILCALIKVGGKIVITEKSVMQNSFWELCKKTKATVFFGVPYIYETLESLNILNNLGKFRITSIAGGRIGNTLMENICKVCAENNVLFYNDYGQTEAGGAILISIKTKNGEYNFSNDIGNLCIAGKVGLDNKEILEDGTSEGELVFESSTMPLGYALKHEDLDKEDEFKGILHTGDIAKVNEYGNYVLVGRSKRFIKIYGKRHSLDHIESTLKDEFINNRFAASGKDNLLVIFYTGEEQDENIKKYIKSRLKLSYQNYKIEHMDTIPLNSNGKVSYKDLLKFIDENY